jgi:hypothetical protein
MRRKLDIKFRILGNKLVDSGIIFTNKSDIFKVQV